MSGVASSLPWALAVGGSLLLGALVATTTGVHERVAAAATVFGGGVLLAAVAFELVPPADREAGPWLTSAGLLAGMAVFVLADWLVERNVRGERGQDAEEVARGESLAAGLFVDGVPESIALGLTLAQGEIGLALLAGIVVSNTSEGYGAAELVRNGGRSRGFALLLLGAIAVAIAGATVAGAFLPGELPIEVLGVGHALAAGAVLATVAVAVIPNAFEKVSRLAAVIAVLGFTAGYLLT